jgi:hypothetical protein
MLRRVHRECLSSALEWGHGGREAVGKNTVGDTVGETESENTREDAPHSLGSTLLAPMGLVLSNLGVVVGAG